jgi:uncharacterized membrane protein (UPF0182 family)
VTFNVPTPQLPQIPPLSRRVRLVFAAVVLLIIAIIVLSVFVSQYTNLLWFRSVNLSSVYTRRLVTELVLFVMFGLAMTVVVAVNVVIAYRFRPAFRPVSPEQEQLEVYRKTLHRFRWWVLGIISGFIGIITGSSASTHWKTWLLWRDGTPFHIKDPQFHKDISYFSFTYPMQRYALSVAFAIVIVSLIAVLLTSYIFGAVRLQTPGPKWTPAGRVHVSVLLGVFVLLKAVAYYLDRYGLAFSGRGIVTGPSYTDVNAVLPAKTILVFVAVICALLFFANIYTRNWLLPAVAFGLMVLSAIVIGGAYPALVQQFKVKPSAQDLEAPYISRNIAATRQAYGISAVKPQSYAGVSPTTDSPATLRAAVDAVAQIRVLDPNIVSQTFEQLQQQRSYYTFPQTLDVDRYPLGTTPGLTDSVVGVRDVNLAGLQPGQRNWINEHLVYTHGYGLVAASANTSTSGGAPSFVEQDLPPTGSIPISANGARIYFGESSPSYSIVGAPAGAPPRELDLPSGSASGQTNTTYAGNGGVPIGSTWRKLLYALKYKDKNILLASGVNAKSQILYVRDPRQRVAKVAPWLTLDGDPYPVVVNGSIEWVVDGYTTTDGYPYSEQQSLGSASKTSLTANSASVAAQRNTHINYIRNSVKATVNAYTGQVTLYEWDQTAPNVKDPVLATWEKAFPGVVKPQTAMPAGLVAHLRYPEDLFNIQRTLLAHYHVTDPHAFYNGTEFWNVPNDPTVSGAVPQPAYYFSMTPNGQPGGTTKPVFSLTSPLVSLNRRNLTGYLSVNSQPGSGNYGKFTLLTVPAERVTDGPQQVQNDIESTTEVSRQLSLLRQGGSRVVLGNLLSVPVDGGFLYVEPVYVQSAGAGSFPVLRRIIAESNGTVSYEPTLDQALNAVFGVKGAAPPATTPPSGTTPPAGNGNGSGRPTKAISPALRQAIAAAQAAEKASQADLRRGDFAAYGADQKKLAAALRQVAAAAGSASSG